jgi:hypothetical protein
MAKIELTPDVIVTFARNLAANTRTTSGGHTEWTGSPKTRLKCSGVRLTPRQAAYTVRAGHTPTSPLRTRCGNSACIEPAHHTTQAPAPAAPASAAAQPAAPPTTGPWEDRAACKGEDTELWYSTNPSERARAKGICVVCPVRAACLDAALAEERGQSKDYRDGIRGGLLAEERISERRRRTEAAKRARRAADRAAA